MRDALFPLVGVIIGALTVGMSLNGMHGASIDGIWDCYHSQATQQYEETGWLCINRNNRDERIDDLITQEN